jgi:hypothetical protein
LRKKLRDARHKAVAAALDSTKVKAKALYQEDKHQDAVELARKLEQKLGAEAQYLGMGKTLTDLRVSYEVLADLARQGKTDPK